MTKKTTLITSVPDRRAIDCTTPMSCEAFLSSTDTGDTAIIEPTFIDFRNASDSSLSYPFLAVNHAADKYQRVAIFLSYTALNAFTYKGYVLDLKGALEAVFEHVKVLTMPMVSCGVPMTGTMLSIVGSHTPWDVPSLKKPMMPSEYFDGLLAHVIRNRPNYPLNVSSRFIGAERSDLKLLPALQQWAGRSLMCEYKQGNSSELIRMKPEHVGKLFGVTPCQYTDELAMVVPAAMIEAYS